MRRNLFLSVIALLSAGVVCGSQAFADTMVAIVLESEGPVKPQLGEHPELTNKQEITLGVGAKLVFSHYHKCEQVTVEGEGVLTVRSGSYQFTGNLREVVGDACPRDIEYISEDMQPSGTVQRGANPLQRILYTENPGLVISKYDSAHIYEVEFRNRGSRSAPIGESDRVDGSVSVTPGETEMQAPIIIKLRARVTAWPEGEIGLKTGSTYEIQLRKNGQNSQNTVLAHIGNPDEFLPSLNILLLNFGNGSLK